MLAWTSAWIRRERAWPAADYAPTLMVETYLEIMAASIEIPASPGGSDSSLGHKS